MTRRTVSRETETGKCRSEVIGRGPAGEWKRDSKCRDVVFDSRLRDGTSYNVTVPGERPFHMPAVSVGFAIFAAFFASAAAFSLASCLSLRSIANLSRLALAASFFIFFRSDLLRLTSLLDECGLLGTSECKVVLTVRASEEPDEDNAGVDVFFCLNKREKAFPPLPSLRLGVLALRVRTCCVFSEF